MSEPRDDHAAAAADIAAVDLLDSVLDGRSTTDEPATGPVAIRALAVAAAYPTDALRAADPPGNIAKYNAERLVTRCVTSARPVLVS
ncbi:hypothetical protein E6R62_38545, partial [Streptomyces sp. A1136]